MATEPLQLARPTVAKSSTKNKYIIIIAGVALSTIVGFSVVTILGMSFPAPYSSTKEAICTAKVLDLAHLGFIRNVGGYYGGIYTCTHMHGFSSVYGKASM